MSRQLGGQAQCQWEETHFVHDAVVVVEGVVETFAVDAMVRCGEACYERMVERIVCFVSHADRTEEPLLVGDESTTRTCFRVPGSVQTSIGLTTKGADDTAARHPADLHPTPP